MSNYFQTLKRLEQEQAESRAKPRTNTIEPLAGRTPTADPSTPSPKPNPDVTSRAVPEAGASSEMPATPDFESIAVANDRPFDERTVGSYSALFDNLSALGDGAPVSKIVVAGVSTVESVERVSTGLAGEICRHGLSVLVAELYRAVSQPVLRVRMASRDEQGESRVRAVNNASRKSVAAELAESPLQLDLRGGPVTPALTDWLDRANKAHDVVLVEAPPLSLSVDAAMFARACHGLILVVEARATARDALTASVERARIVGCPVLGIVMQGRPERVPTWIRRIIASRNLF